MPTSSIRLPLLAAFLLCLSPGCATRAPSTPASGLPRAPPRLTRVRALTLPVPEVPGGASYVAAASGLVRVGGWLHVVSDDSLFLASFPAEDDGPGQWTRLLPGGLPRDPARRGLSKPDFEALCLVTGLALAPDGALLAVPSGSSPSRMRGALLPLRAEGRPGESVREVDFTDLYARLARELGPVNVEGAVWVGSELWLLNRGNAPGGADAVVKLAGEGFARALDAGTPPGPEGVRSVTRWTLGRMNGVRLTFSDAAPLLDGRVVFTASAEDTGASQTDGSGVGSAVGLLSVQGAPVWLERVEGQVKLEGVTARREQGLLHVWLVSDADDPAVVAPLFTLSFEDPAVPGGPGR